MNYSRGLLLLGVLVSAPLSAQNIIEVIPRVCSPNIHEQPNGPFALHVFCGDASRTNVAVFLTKLDNRLSGKYGLGRRYWLGEPWASDVTTYAWLEDGKHMLVATSYIYGTGSVYLLDLETQQFEVKKPIPNGACLASLRQINDKKIAVGVTDCEGKEEHKVEFAI